MPLAESMARGFRGRGVSDEDLTAEAYLGLCEAAADADRAKTSFSGFARGKIRTRIMTALGNASVVRFDVRSERAGNHVKRCRIAVERMTMNYPFPDLDAEVNPCSIGPSETSSTLSLAGMSLCP